MKHSYNLVNPFISLRLRFLWRPCFRNHLITLTFSVSTEAEANYNKPRRGFAREQERKIQSYNGRICPTRASRSAAKTVR